VPKLVTGDAGETVYALIRRARSVHVRIAHLPLGES
jgi:hypothetical protein